MAEENFLHPRYWPTWVGYWLIWVVVRLPQRVRLFIGARLGDLARWLAVDRRRIVLRNIELCFPELDEQARARLVRDIFRSGGMSIIETAVAWLGRGSSVVGRMTIEGVEHLRAAQARGKGVILMGMHMQTLDLAGACLSQEIGLNVMYRANKNLLIEKIMTEGRKRLYPSAIERGDVRSVISSLSAGDIVWYGPDQDYGARNAVFVPFLGVPAATTTAASRIAKITGAAVVPITYLRVDNGRSYRIVMKPAMENFPSGSYEDDAVRINAFIEECIRAYPEQYWWFHRRFKTRPAGEPDLYRRQVANN